MLALLLALAMQAAAPAAASAEAPLLSHTDLKPMALKADARVRYGTAPSQYADLFLPTGKGPHPVVAIVHGGCWQAEVASADIMNAAADDLRRRGYAVWNIEYRRVGEPGGGYPGMYQDVGAAFDALGREARARNLDLSRLVALGHSAGGHLALWAAARPALPVASPLRTAAPLPIPAVLSVGGIGDLSVADTDPRFSRACGAEVIKSLAGVGPDRYADVSPARLAAPFVRTVMLHGRREQVAPLDLGRGYAARQGALGGRVEVVETSGGHFEVITPGTSDWATVVQTVERLSQSSAIRGASGENRP